MSEKNLPVGELVELPLDQFLALYPEELHPQLNELLSKQGVDALVDCYNPDFWSSQCGCRTAVSVGPGCTFKSPKELEGKWLGQAASDRKYAKHFTKRAP